MVDRIPPPVPPRGEAPKRDTRRAAGSGQETLGKGPQTPGKGLILLSGKSRLVEEVQSASFYIHHNPGRGGNIRDEFG
jgi:hypothetical protein